MHLDLNSPVPTHGTVSAHYGSVVLLVLQQQQHRTFTARLIGIVLAPT